MITFRQARPKRLSRFNFRRPAYAFLSSVGIFAATFSSTSSALAEAEESTGQETSNPAYSISSPYTSVLTNFVIGDYADEEVSRYLSTLVGFHNTEDTAHSTIETNNGRSRSSPSSTIPQRLDDPLIPEAVWSLDASSGAHLDRVSGGLGYDNYPVFGSRPGIDQLWIRAITSQLSYNGTNNLPSALFTAIQFQVASCGGASAERSNLDYCNSTEQLDDQMNDSIINLTRNSNNNPTLIPNNNSPSSSSSKSDPTGQPVIAPRLPAAIDQSSSQETFNVINLCDVYASCSSIVKDPLKMLVDQPADPPTLGSSLPQLDLPQPVNDQTSPVDSSSSEPSPPVEDDTGDPGLTPVFPTPHDPVTTPETSTWVMTIIGFGFMAFVFRKRRTSRNNPISIVDLSEYT
jgi:hypothetical protein